MNRRKRIATNRTEFSRYVDDNPTCIPEWEELRVAYFSKKHGQRPAFGFYIRSYYADKFLIKYDSWWLNHPELWSGGVNQDILANAHTTRSVA